MKKIAFCAAAGNGISPLEQIMIKKGYEVYGSDSSFDEGLNQDRKAALESVGLKIVPQDGSAVFPDTECLYISSIINEENPDIKAARKYNVPVKKRSDLLEEIFSGYAKGIGRRRHRRQNHNHRDDRIHPRPPRAETLYD